MMHGMYTPAVDRRIAQEIARNIRNAGYVSDMAQVLMLVEEAGEFAGAYRRYSGHARRSGTYVEMAHELADVVIGAWVAADFLEIDLDTAIREKLEIVNSRGWREQPS